VLDNLPDHPLREGIGRSPLFARGPAPARAAEPAPEFADPPSAEREGIHARLLELLDPSPVAVDELVRRCGFPAAAVNGVLLDLEIAGRIETLPGNRVTLLG
jgi:DNA processing protein